MKRQPTLPTFGEIVPGEGGRLGAIMRGHVISGEREPDYAIIVPDLPSANLQWGTYGVEIAGAKSLTDGLRNTADMLAANCPPALHVVKLVTSDGHTDLYLPARGELWALRANVPELFEKAWHWSSTQDDRYGAVAQDFEYGTSRWDFKDGALRVRAVRRIPLQHFNA